MTPDVGRGGLSALANLRVVELGVWVAAPAAAGLLADWGADVIKVEAPAGDPMRNVFGSLGIGSDMPNPAFALENRGKRSVSLNLREPADRKHFEDLLATADVFISNLRPDALDAFDLEPAATVAAPSSTRVLQHQWLRAARRGAQPAHLRHRCLLGTVRTVDADGRPGRQSTECPRGNR